MAELPFRPATFQSRIFDIGRSASFAKLTVKTADFTQTSHWYARMQFKGTRELLPLGTANKAVAAAKARDAYLFLAANGWEQTLAKYKPKTKISPAIEATVTIGSFLEAVFNAGTNRSTIEG